MINIGSVNSTGGGETFAKTLIKTIGAWDDLDERTLCLLYNGNPVDLERFYAPFLSAKVSLNIYRIPSSPIGTPLTDLTLLLCALKLIFLQNDIYIFDRPSVLCRFVRKSLIFIHGPSSFRTIDRSDNIFRDIKAWWQILTIRRWLTKRLFKTKDVVFLFNSQYSFSSVKQMLRSDDGDSRCLNNWKVTGLPVDVVDSANSGSNARIRESLGFGSADVIFSYHSNFCKRKLADFDSSVAIFEEILAVPMNRILLIGRWIDADLDLQRWINAHPRVTWLGELDNFSTLKVLQVTDVYFNLSQVETFGYAIAEAMSMALPVVVWNKTAPREFIQHGRSGLLANSEDEFKDHLRRLGRDLSYRESLGSGAKRSILSQFGVERFSTELHKLIRHA